MSISITDGPGNEYMKVDKISDDVYALAPNIILKFNVALSKISGGKRYHYHKEYEYQNRTINEPLVTVKRSFDYYMSFESQKSDDDGNKLFIRIGAQEYFYLKKGLEEVIAWFTDKKYAKLFATSKGKLILTSPIPNFRITSLPMQKYIEFTPTIIDRGIANADKEFGIKIEFGEPSTVIEITLDKLMGLYYTISNFSMYEAAAILINYNHRPDYGTNRYIMGGGTGRTLPPEKSMSGASGIVGRQVTPKGAKNNISTLEG